MRAMLGWLRPPMWAAMVLVMAGCAGKRDAVTIVAAPAPLVVPAAPPGPPPVSALNRDLTGVATVWHLRVALNVAALACRGPQELTIVADYNALLAAHRTALASAQVALSAEYRGGGGDWQDRYDDAMTRLYNFFSQAQARDRFCATAQGVLAESRGLAPESLPQFAAARLPLLDRPFAEMLAPAVRPFPDQVIAVAAPVPHGPQPGAAPRLAALSAPAVRAPVQAVQAVPRLHVVAAQLGD